MTPQEVLGLPLETARQLLEAEGYRVEITPYRAKREIENAHDVRVLRCSLAPPAARLVVSAFFTAPSAGEEQDA